MSKLLACWCTVTKLWENDISFISWKKALRLLTDVFLCARIQPSFSLSLTAGAKKLANKAALWYVPCSLQNVDKIMEVPPIKVCGNSCSDLHGAKFGISPIGFSVSIWLCPSDMTGWEGQDKGIHETNHLEKDKKKYSHSTVWKVCLTVMRLLCPKPNSYRTLITRGPHEI